jgi:hypothetical protein
MLSQYHQKWTEKSDEAIRHFVLVKELQFRQVFASIGAPAFVSPTPRIAILGCKERRLALWQNEMFSRLLAKPTAVTTFEITTEHLSGVPGVIQHDATEPLPGGPFDLVYADVLVRFIAPEKQLTVLIDSWEALAPGGMAVIAFSHNDYDPRPDYVPAPDTYRVDMNALQLELSKRSIPFLEIPVVIETTPPGKADKIDIDDLFLVMRKP